MVVVRAVVVFYWEKAQNGAMTVATMAAITI